MMGTRRWSGEKDTGSREFTPKEAAGVVAFFKGYVCGRENAQEIDDIARACELRGRTLRAIISEIDGRELVVAQDEGLVWMAEFEDDTESATAQLFSRARRIRERAERRQAMAANLPRRQGRLM